MSSNVGAEAKAAYNRYLDAGSLEEKIKFLGEFISLVPKHKGTEKIVALNKSRLSKLKREVEDNKTRQRTVQKVVSPFSIKKEGIQVILISSYFTPGTGKTTVLNYLTGAAKANIGKFTPLPEMKIADVLDLFTPLILIPLYYLLFYFGSSQNPGLKSTLLFLVFAVLWVEGQAMHLGANSIGHWLVNLMSEDVYEVTHFYDEVLSHIL